MQHSLSSDHCGRGERTRAESLMRSFDKAMMPRAKGAARLLILHLEYDRRR